MSRKSPKIAALIENCRGRELPAHYLGYFECFNRGLFYEAHDVLEELWLPARHGPDGLFYQGLIQFAGAFVHLQKERLRPAAALLQKAINNLSKYPGRYQHLDVRAVLTEAELWLQRLNSHDFTVNPLHTHPAPVLAPDPASAPLE